MAAHETASQHSWEMEKISDCSRSESDQLSENFKLSGKLVGRGNNPRARFPAPAGRVNLALKCFKCKNPKDPMPTGCPSISNHCTAEFHGATSLRPFSDARVEDPATVLSAPEGERASLRVASSDFDVAATSGSSTPTWPELITSSLPCVHVRLCCEKGSKCHLIPHPQRLQELSLSCFGLLVLAFGFCSSFALSFSFSPSCLCPCHLFLFLSGDCRGPTRSMTTDLPWAKTPFRRRALLAFDGVGRSVRCERELVLLRRPHKFLNTLRCPQPCFDAVSTARSLAARVSAK